MISKLYLNADSSTSLKEFEDAVEKAIHETQERLQMDCIPGLLLHRPHVLAQFGSRLTDILQRHVKRGHVSKFGVSLLNFDPGPFAEFAFSYIRHMPGIFSIVFGAETVDQVRENVAMLDVPPIREQTIEELERAFAEVPEFVVTPSLWKANK